MPVMKFRHFEDQDRLEKEGKGISWRFKPDGAYFKKVLRFRIRVPFPLIRRCVAKLCLSVCTDACLAMPAFFTAFSGTREREMRKS